MRFQNIKITEAEVSLDRLDKQADGSTAKTELSNPSRPLAPFVAAMQAFSGYAVDLIGAPEWHDEIKVTSIHLSEEPKTSRRGLIVTFTRKIERAKNRVVVVNTPLMHAPVDDQEGTNPGTFPVAVAGMIHDLEEEATKYWKGEREQAEIFADTSTASSSEETPTTPAARKPLPQKTAGSPGEIVNPDKTVPPADEVLRRLLLAAGRDVPIDAIALWGSQDRDKAQRWATAQARVRSGDLRADAAPKEPKIVIEHATPALSEELITTGGAK